MKNKKTLYIFLSVNIIVWGLVIYKLFSSFKEENAASVPNSSIIPVSSATVAADTFSLLADYPDPFLRKAAIVNDKSGDPQPVKIKKPQQSKAPIVWPTIVYGGLIKNQKSSKQLVLVQVNGQENFMNEGSTASEVQLIKVFKDSIRVLYKNEKEDHT